MSKTAILFAWGGQACYVEDTMHTRSVAFAILVSAMLNWGTASAFAEDAPKGNKGFTASKTTVVDLGPKSRHGPGGNCECACSPSNPAATLACIVTKIGLPSFISCRVTDEVGLADGSKKTCTPAILRPRRAHNALPSQVGKDNVVLIAVDVFHPKK